MTAYACPACDRRFAVTVDRFRCECGGPLDLDFEPGKIDRDSLPRRPANLWRWHEALPLPAPLPGDVLGGGPSPIVRDVLAGVPVHFVLEYVAPTGSYKDRGAALLVAIASDLGAEEVVDDTSGNAGIALAAHAARAGIHARVIVPSDAPEGKSWLAASFGAEIVRIEGGRAAAAAAALREAAGGAFYASHAWSPFFLHGAKTLAYAIAEGTGWSPPGAVVVPCGNGGLVLGLDLGFRELRRHGLIARRPALLAVQAASCAPLASAFEGGGEVPLPVLEGATVADGIRVAAPPRGAEVLRAVRRSGGRIDRVDDSEIEAARALLWSKGYAVEPTAAVGAALVARDGREIRERHGDVAIVLTGSGLKSGRR